MKTYKGIGLLNEAQVVEKISFLLQELEDCLSEKMDITDD